MRSLKLEISEILSLALEIQAEEVSLMLTLPPRADMGDFAFPCFKFAKENRISPKDAAQQLSLKMADVLKEYDLIEQARPEGPYINIFLNRKEVYARYKEYFKHIAGKSFKRDRANKTVVIDYSSPNIAKPIAFHHIRSTVIGSIIGNIFETAGYTVVRINYLGDWGTQFGKLVTAFEKYGNDEKLQKEGIRHLLDIYVQYHKDETPEFNSLAKEWFKRMEAGDVKALEYWSKFREISIKEFDRVYKRLGVVFTHTEGESFYKDPSAVIESIHNKIGTVVSEGAVIVDLSEYDMPPMLLEKTDGTKLYATRDLAAAIDRQKRFVFDESLYVVGNQQDLHFKQLFKVLELMGFDWHSKCKHVQFGLLHLADTKMSTREGKVIFLDEVLDKSVELAIKAIEEKNPDLSNKEEVAEAVGVGAIVFGDIVKRRTQDIAFKWDDILNFDGETAPYVQYTHARAGSILRKADFMQSTSIETAYEPNDAEFELIKLFYSFDDKIDEAKKDHEPFVIARYVLDIARSFNRFYYQEKIIDVDNEIAKQEKLFIIYTIKELLKQNLAILGIRAPERM